MDKKRVVITGQSIISPLGNDWPSIFQNLKKYEPCNIIETFNNDGDFFYSSILPQHNFSRKDLRCSNKSSLMALIASNEALKDSKIEDKDIGIFYNGNFGDFRTMKALSNAVEDKSPRFLSPIDYLRGLPNTNSHLISFNLKLNGPTYCINNACASSSQAIGLAYKSILNGELKIALCGGANEFSFGDLLMLKACNTISQKTTSCFDKDRDGFIAGDGAATFILEDLDHALERNAKIYCEISGYATNTGFGSNSFAPNTESQSKCMENALKDANIDSNSIGYINAHATGTLLGDKSEAEATYKIFKRSVPISSTKSYLGHSLPACGAIESFIAMNMMRENWFHPNVNLYNIDEGLPPLDYIKDEGRIIDIDYIMSNNFAFGGINTSLIFKKWKNI